MLLHSPRAVLFTCFASGLHPEILLLQPPKCWGCRCALPQPTKMFPWILLFQSLIFYKLSFFFTFLFVCFVLETGCHVAQPGLILPTWMRMTLNSWSCYLMVLGLHQWLTIPSFRSFWLPLSLSLKSCLYCRSSDASLDQLNNQPVSDEAQKQLLYIIGWILDSWDLQIVLMAIKYFIFSLFLFTAHSLFSLE